MTKRERVERAMALQETDRVPLYDILLCDRAIEHFSGETLPLLAENPETRATVDRMTGRAIAAMLDATRHSTFGPLADREFADEFGFQYHEDAFEKTTWIVKRPFGDVAGAAEFLKQDTAKLVEGTRKAEVIRAGADGIAVVSAICAAPDPREAARRLRAMTDDVRRALYR